MRIGAGQRLVLAGAGLAIALLVLSMSWGGPARHRSDVGAGHAAPLVDWPLFGRVPERTHYLPDEGRELDPPLHETWSINTHALIEFPPVIAGGVAYVVNKYGNMKAVRLSDRKILWERARDPKQKGQPTDTTALVYDQGRVFVAFEDGDLVAVNTITGRTVWKRDLHAHLESSPLAVDGNVYLGDDRKELVALRAADGKVLWRFNSPGAIKASPSHHDGRVCVADYEASMYCLDADDGHVLWRTNTSKVPPFGEGGFYSSPAIAFGHIYAARDDGAIYAFDEKTGKVAWSFQTHHYIYGSPAVAQVPGTPPSVYIGGYDEQLHALDALSGKPRWRVDVGGAVPGTAVVIGHTVYTSSFKTDRTIGIDVRTHHRTFSVHQAGYTPVVSDGRRLFVIGYYELVGMAPTRR